MKIRSLGHGNKDREILEFIQLSGKDEDLLEIYRTQTSLICTLVRLENDRRKAEYAATNPLQNKTMNMNRTGGIVGSYDYSDDDNDDDE